jgi:hypothetical protein
LWFKNKEIQDIPNRTLRLECFNALLFVSYLLVLNLVLESFGFSEWLIFLTMWVTLVPRKFLRNPKKIESFQSLMRVEVKPASISEPIVINKQLLYDTLGII